MSDKKVIALALAAATVLTVAGCHSISEKAEEYEDQMSRSSAIVSTAEPHTVIDLDTSTPEIDTVESVPCGVPVVEQDEPTTTTQTETTTGLDRLLLGVFEITAYCSCEKCCGEWADGITYTGTTATEGRTISVDPDVIPLGSKVIINGQAYIAEDTGGAIRGHRIDMFFDSHTEALEFGVQTASVSIVL